MVEALKGSANLSITGRPNDKKRSVKYQVGDKPWLEIHRIKIANCNHAWKYSDPSPCDEPLQIHRRFKVPKSENYLISFYDLLAKIQTECFMHRYVMSKSIQVSNDEMKLLEWLHEAVRNEFEHFIPKLYSVFILDLIKSSLFALQLSYRLIFESGNIIIDIPKHLSETFRRVEKSLNIKEKGYINLCEKHDKSNNIMRW
ncbi:MAG: hypothetical protein AMJ73_05705 [candidate division Zixibacteria bacterium SM1_73]|nr:MAG: hypothetical protein AMJ73_05705 [candidate division Zixibacteria bacterium SM1_73]